MSEDTAHSGLYDGFDAYRTATAADYQRLLTKSLVVLDANVFLDLYRYSEQTRRDLFAVMERLGDRLWVPRQVLVEFWRNRESRLRTPVTPIRLPASWQTSVMRPLPSSVGGQTESALNLAAGTSWQARYRRRSKA